VSGQADRQWYVAVVNVKEDDPARLLVAPAKDADVEGRELYTHFEIAFFRALVCGADGCRHGSRSFCGAVQVCKVATLGCIAAMLLSFLGAGQYGVIPMRGLRSPPQPRGAMRVLSEPSRAVRTC